MLKGVGGVFLMGTGVPSSARGAVSDEIFTDVTQNAGITWRHFNGASPDHFLIETMGSGVAFLDFDQDGLLDIFFVNGGETPRGKAPGPVLNALYRNLGNGKFQNVAAKAGVDRLPFYGMGAAVADYDNDGFPDLFVTGYPRCALFHNNGDGTFTDVTVKAGVENLGRWAAGSAWFDYDRDGFLDLVVCNYVKFSYDDPKLCEYGGALTYCSPQMDYDGVPLALYHNNGDGTFSDVSAHSGLLQQVGRALNVVSIDMDDDGWPDLYVARDGSPNLLLINKHDGTFHDIAMDAEVALDPNGNAKAGMAVDAGDANGDGHPDLVITNFNDQYTSLYLNRGALPYDDWTEQSNLARFTGPMMGWGVHWLDFDNDGNLDLMFVNGHYDRVIEMMRSDVFFKEEPMLLRNNGNGVFENVRGKAGPTFGARYSARGLAVGDFDNDGATDAVFTCLNEGPVLLRNNIGSHNPWIGFQLLGTRSNRDAIGAKLTLRIGNRKLVRWITSGSSYLSSHDKRVIFGLGPSHGSNPLVLDIQWPSGQAQTVSDLRPNRYHLVREPGPNR
jgi:hypothetical protein